MIREIKFRAWDDINKKFPFIGFSIVGEVTVFNLDRQYELKHLLKLEITQFTGLKDKNGKEIYEGDICYMNDILCHVVFEEGAFLLQSKKLQESFCMYEYIYNKFEVIGNIFENPELL
jgi:hypothetical protein